MPSLYVPVALSVIVATTSKGLICTYSAYCQRCYRMTAVPHTQNASLQVEQRPGVTDVHWSQEEVDGKGMGYWRSAMKQNEQRPFAAKVSDEELEEGVDDESL